MSHGSKKWITAWDGKIKRSNDRTKKDYYRDMRWWHEYENGSRYTYRGRKAEFCPQCKHVAKPFLAERAVMAKAMKERRAEYDRMFGDAVREWNEYRRLGWMILYPKPGTDALNFKERKMPRSPEPPPYYKWDHENEYIPRWDYNTRNFLCYKHERKYEVKHDEYWAYWNGNGGYPRKHTSARRAENRNYRNDMKNIMQRAKFDEEYYDRLCKKKNGWLD